MRTITIAIASLLLVLAPADVSAQRAPLFVTSESCVACHNGLTTPTGQDASFGFNWRGSMMANSARDPYWQAAVRREVTDHPQASGVIQNECSACHMPMSRYQANAQGRKGGVFANLIDMKTNNKSRRAAIAADGVSCSLCHQISADRLGTPASFTAGFAIDTALPVGQRRVFGPYHVDRGRDRLMRSASGFRPVRGLHIQKAEVCATCHTLFTHAIGPDGKHTGTLPEQVPYLEWKHSAYRTERSCQSCHMPIVDGKMPLSGVLGLQRSGFSQHLFRGGNFFLPRLLNRYRKALGVVALPQELEIVASGAADHLASSSARLQLRLRPVGDDLEVVVAVANLAGHKLPTAYPSRRAWLQLTARDANNRVLLESGALQPDGKIRGNDNDADRTRFEPHHLLIDSPDKVQIYEAIMVDHAGKVTTGLLRAVRYVKDNRILPRGFDKRTASADVAVHGEAAADDDFVAGIDRVRYRVPLSKEIDGPLTIEVVLRYQPIGFRWATNLAGYAAPEPRRFVTYYQSMAPSSSVAIARATASWQVPEPPAEPVR